jgi:polysaccharide deacetylase family protein (PEP-CTERM system associated)
MPDAIERGPKPMACAALSIDVEDWFHVHNLEAMVARDTWHARELRVERNTERMLELMAERGARCTFFVLGWVAERCPGLIRRIAAAGHEIATQGYGHELLHNLSPAAFREDVKRGIGLVEAAGGQEIRGHRAPSFSITEWALDILQELGLAYDSSAFPIALHDRYGRLSSIDASECIAEVRPGFYEICLSTVRIGQLGVPWAGGGYFRLLPYRLFAHGIRRILGSGRPYVFYLHPWEIDPGQPRVHGLKRAHAFRHYNNLARSEPRFVRLLEDFQWTTVADLLAAHLADRHDQVPQSNPTVTTAGSILAAAPAGRAPRSGLAVEVPDVAARRRRSRPAQHRIHPAAPFAK